MLSDYEMSIRNALIRFIHKFINCCETSIYSDYELDADSYVIYVECYRYQREIVSDAIENGLDKNYVPYISILSNNQSPCIHKFIIKREHVENLLVLNKMKGD